MLSKDKKDHLSLDMHTIKAQSRLYGLQIQSKKLVNSFFTGNYRSFFRGQGLAFLETRPYVIGDDIRFIDWNVSSRLNETYCKVFTEERELQFMFVLDVSASVTDVFASKKIELMEEVFALLGFAATHHGDLVGSLAFSQDIAWFSPAKHGNPYFLSQLKKLISQPKEQHGSDLSLALRRIGELMKRRGICIIISDFHTENYWSDLSLLAARHDVIAIRLEDAFDSDFPPMGYLKVYDTEEFDQAGFFSLSKKFQREYKGYWETMASQWKKNCHKRGVKTLTIHSNDNLIERLYNFFHIRGQ